MVSPATFTPDQLAEMFHAAVAAGDARGVEASLLAMTAQDPRRAASLYDDLRTALAVAQVVESRRCTGVGAQWCPVHGTCRCPDRERAMDDPGCPLHSATSDHAEGGENGA